MTLRVLGFVLILDGALAVSAAAGVADTFVYRNLRDQALTVALALAGLWSGMTGYLLGSGRRATRLAMSALALSLAVAAARTTPFDWPVLAVRATVTAAVVWLLWRWRDR
jgi:hypothetical protein